MSGWRKFWETDLPGTVKSPKSGRQTVAEEKPFQRRCNLGTISMSLEVIWGMSVKMLGLPSGRGSSSLAASSASLSGRRPSVMPRFRAL